MIVEKLHNHIVTAARYLTVELVNATNGYLRVSKHFVREELASSSHSLMR